MKYVKYAFAVAAVLIVIFASALSPKPKTKSDFLLDTYISVTIYDGTEEALDAVVAKVRQIHEDFSAYAADSEVANINKAPAGEAVFVSSECFSLLEKAQALSEMTEGAFDITVKPIMDLWDFSGTPKVPEETELSALLPAVDYRKLILDEENKTVTKTAEHMQIDLGGIAKGYAADCAAIVLKEHGVENAVLDFGGNVVTIGARPVSLWERIKTGKSTAPFAVGIQSPGEARGIVAERVVATISPCAVVTSGGYERNFTQDGKIYHHIIDPKTGRQPENGILSVTVVATDATCADALSTALFVLGPEGVSRAEGLYEKIIFMTEQGEMKTYTKE